MEYNLENFRFREALKAAMDLARLGNKYLADNEPWKLIKTDRVRQRYHSEHCPADHGQPGHHHGTFLPFSAKKIAGFINMGDIAWNDAGRARSAESRSLLDEPSLLFEKIEDDSVEKQLQKLQQTKETNQSKTSCQTAEGQYQLR